jgi:hypothetical protein
MKAVTPEGETIGWGCWAFVGFEDGGGGRENVLPPVEYAVKSKSHSRKKRRKKKRWD